MLLIQGVGVHGEGWLPQVDEMSSRARCLWFDNRGIGNGPPLSGRLTVEQMADDALRVMESHGITSAHIVGHSLGGVVAQCLAIESPQSVRSLSLLCTVARGRDATRLSPRILWLGVRSRIGPRRARRRAFVRLIAPPGALAKSDLDAMASRLEPLFGHDLADQPRIVMDQLRALRGYDSTPHLSKLACTPTLVVSAEHDPIAPPGLGRSLARAIPGARFVELSGTSHGVPIHRADLINSLLLEHIAAAEAR